MSNNDSNASNKKDSAKNDTVTGVEVVKDDTVVYEDGDFDEYNAEHDLEVNTDATLSGDDKGKDASKDDQSDKDDKPSKDDKKDAKKDSKSAKNDKSDKDQKSDKEDKSEKDDKADSDKEDKTSKSDKKDKANKKDKSDEDDKSGITMAGIYQWASKLKDDFKSDAVDMKHEVSEKATAMMLSKLLDAVDMELAAFDKSLDVAKNLLATAEERRKKIAAKKEKYQGMIDKLDQE